MSYQIIDNFLTEDNFLKVRNSILNPKFSWHMTPYVTYESKLEETIKVTSSYYFTHLFYNRFFVSPECNIFTDILNQLEVKSLIRIKGNLYPSTDNIEYHAEHNDYDYEHKGAIFYLNTNDGFTILEDGTKIESISNRMLLFDPSKSHNSTTCTNDKCRVNVNFNFF
tara:strand:+ start:4985 stop:5485 length:501 start_codon:yes stop_codon:yes gene_type:complete